MDLPPLAVPSIASRHMLLVSRLKQILQWHDTASRPLPASGRRIGIGIGIIAFGGLSGLGFSTGLLVGQDATLAAPVALTVALPLSILATLGHLRYRARRQLLLARAGLEVRILHLLREFPEAVAAWGGPRRLLDVAFVREAIRQLEPLSRLSSGGFTVPMNGTVTPMPYGPRLDG